MAADFQDAHNRHWEDAEILKLKGRWANADHLFGLAAECGLKCLMLKFGMPYDSSRDRPHHREDRVHADELWTRFESYRSNHSAGTGFVLSSANPFLNWKISQRYDHQNDFDEPRTETHKSGAWEVRTLVMQAMRRGWL